MTLFGNLHGGDGRREVAHLRAAVSIRGDKPKKTEFRHLLDDPVVVAMPPLVFSNGRWDLLLGKLPRRIPNHRLLCCQTEIHDPPPYLFIIELLPGFFEDTVLSANYITKYASYQGLEMR